jgi:hypothetical protein
VDEKQFVVGLLNSAMVETPPLTANLVPAQNLARKRAQEFGQTQLYESHERGNDVVTTTTAPPEAVEHPSSLSQTLLRRSGSGDELERRPRGLYVAVTCKPTSVADG